MEKPKIKETSKEDLLKNIVEKLTARELELYKKIREEDSVEKKRELEKELLNIQKELASFSSVAAKMENK